MSLIRIHPFGPVYTAVEDTAVPVHQPSLEELFNAVEPDDPWLSSAWMSETEPPYRTGRAIRIRTSPTRAYHLGICRKSKRPTARTIDASIEEITQWRGPRSV